MSRFKTVFLRHGESEWTLDNLFCGWVDVGLTEKGKNEARQAASSLITENLKFDIVYTSLLKRANQTLDIILREIRQPDLPVKQAWQLNERHYGALTGYNKADMAAKYGKEQVNIWRRSFDVLPPPMEPDHKYYTTIVNNPKFQFIKDKIPKTESLKTTMQRVIPFWEENIVPDVKSGKRVLVIGHGTSLRSLVKHLSRLSDEAIMKLNLPTGIPFVYEFGEDFKPIVCMRFLSDEETVKKAMDKVASIGETSAQKRNE